MKRLLLSLVSSILLLSVQAQISEYDYNAPFGWATSTSLTTGDSYQLTGGGNGATVTIVNNGGDMRSDITNALKDNDVVILDGAAGDFVVSKTIELKNLKNKTIVGVNNARLCTQFYVTPAIVEKLDEVGVKGMSSSGGGGTLSNGQYVAEERERATRQTLIDLLNDEKEQFRDAGIFYLSECENIIIRNLQLVGPGPVDVGGDDLVSLINSTNHVWIDHCNFTDGLDGNLDITVKSDFVTVSWCTFAYTERAYDHMNSNLIGSSESASTQGENNLNVTWANNIWGKGCRQRMPMARFGAIHLINNYYDCAGNSAGINAGKNSEFLIENNYFEAGVKKIFSENGAKAYTWEGNIFTEYFTASNRGNVSVPYRYNIFAAFDVPRVLTDTANGAGATLDNPMDMTPGQLPDAPDNPNVPDTPGETTREWVFDRWAEEGVIPTAINENFTYEGLTIIYGPKSKFTVSEKLFSDGMVYNHCYNVGGAGSPGSQALSLECVAGASLIVYSNAGEKGRYVVFSDGEDELYRESNDIIKYPFTTEGPLYIYSANSGICFYALSILEPTQVDDSNFQTSSLRYDRHTFYATQGANIEVYNMQGVCVARGESLLGIEHLSRGVYLARCGNQVLKVVR